MTRSGILRLRLALTLVGFTIWAYGARSHQNVFLWIGIAVMGLSVIARFLGRR